MKILQKAFSCYDIEQPFFDEVVLAETRGKAKSYFLSDKELLFTSVGCKRVPMEDVLLINGKKVKRYAYLNTLEHQKWKKEMQNLVSNNPSKKVYIWSGQWGAYWRPKQMWLY